MDKLNLISLEDISTAINTVLYNHDLISKEIYIKCSKPKYITDLPGDLRSNDPNELELRLSAIDDAISNRESILQDAEKRINAKTKDNEKLANRIDKNIEKMDKAMDNIASESDKIVNKINKSDFENKTRNWSDDSFEGDEAYFKNNLMTNFNTFREAHNDFFQKDLTEANISDYEKSFEDYVDASTTFASGVEIGYEEGVYTKGDVKNADISPNTTRIRKNIDTFKNTGMSISEDVESMANNQQDIDYIAKQSRGVSKEIDVLLDEYEKTYNKYSESGGGTRQSPNPQMLLDVDARSGDTFTLLPPNYDKYMV